MQALRIIHIVGSIEAEAAGPSYSVPRLARALLDTGHDCELMSLGASSLDKTMGVEHTRFPMRLRGFGPLGKLGVSPAMRRALNERAGIVDILHTNGLWTMPNCYPSEVVRPGQTEVVLSPRGMLSEAALEYSASSKRVFWKLQQHRALRRVSLFHATSDMEYEDIRRSGFGQPVVILPNGIDLPDVTEARQQRSNDFRTILFLGRLHPIKRLETLIESWSNLEASLPNWRLVIRGPGDFDYVSKLRGYAASLGVGRCEFGEAVYGSNKLRAFQEASVYVLPSASENFAMTIAESLASGTPVIASQGTPWSGLLKNRCGWWVEHGVAPLTAALRDATSLPVGVLQRMGANGQAWVRGAFSWESIGQDMASAYHWLRFGGDRPPFVHA